MLIKEIVRTVLDVSFICTLYGLHLYLRAGYQEITKAVRSFLSFSLEGYEPVHPLNI